MRKKPKSIGLSLPERCCRSMKLSFDDRDTCSESGDSKRGAPGTPNLLGSAAPSFIAIWSTCQMHFRLNCMSMELPDYSFFLSI